MNKLLCAIYVAFWVGIACGDIGEMPAIPAEPYEWYLPLLILAFLAPPLLMAYFAGREDAGA